MDTAELFIAAIINTFEANKRLADRAVEQVPDDKLHVALDANTNSIAVIMKHVAGNLISRWTDFLTSDGEKPDRDRDGEFEAPPIATREAVLGEWEDSLQLWCIPKRALSSLLRAPFFEAENRARLSALVPATNRGSR